MNTTLLLDGDIVLHRAVASATKNLIFGSEATTSCDLDAAKANVDHDVASALVNFKAKRAIIALSDPERYYFRHDVMPEYKSGRRKGDLLGYNALRDYMLSTYDCEWEHLLEADDVLGMLSTKPHISRRIIVSIDKDLRTIPGFYSPSFTGEIEKITEAGAFHSFLVQVLMGDQFT